MDGHIKITRRNTLKGEDEYRVISIRAKRETLDRLERLAALTDRSRNELINLLLQAALEQVIIESD